MLNDFVETFGFRPGSLNPLLSAQGFVGGMEADLVALRLAKMEEGCWEVEKEAKEGNEEERRFWFGVLEDMKANLNSAKRLAKHFEFSG